MKIEGVQHEFQTVEGVVEDVTDIVLNLKRIRLVSHSREPVQLTIDVEKEGVITAGDIEGDANIEILNPEQVICTLDTKSVFRLTLLPGWAGLLHRRGEQEGGPGHWGDSGRLPFQSRSAC